MSLTHRSSAFLREMGIGPHWLLRDRAHAAPAGEPGPFAGDEAAMADTPGAAALAAQAIEPIETTEAAPPRGVEARREEAVGEEATRAGREEGGAAPAVPAFVPAPAPAAAGGEDMSWFDDAPAPPPRTPTLKQAAAPRARAAAPETGEDTSWFDAVPAAPVQRAPARGAVTDAAIAAMDWPELQHAVRGCTRCALCETRRAAVPGQGDERARWLVLGLAPGGADEKAEQPFAGAPGQLLQNMLRAVDLSTGQGAYVTTLVKCRPLADDGTERLPTAQELAACRPYLEREAVLTGAGLALTLGGVTAKGLLGMAARGKVLTFQHAQGDLPVVATFHPADLLKKPEDKPKAWADLCLARAAHAGRR